MAANMSGDAGQKAVLSWIRERENTRATSSGAADDERSSANKEWCPEMTKAAIRAAALTHEGYETPELNDILYLHFKGFRRIENLDEYVNLKALFLDSNGFAVIENLSHLSKLRCLYLQNNMIERVTGLEGLVSLVTLDLSHNRLSHIENLSVLPNLETLNLSRNNLSTVASLQHLRDCPRISNVDISHNSVEDVAVIEEVLARMPMLVSINIAGNPVVTETPQFRKRVICAMPNLRYLDRPVFELERLTAEAWKEGGREAEVAARDAFNQRQKDEHRAQLQSYRDWVADIRRRKAEEAAERKTQTGGSSGERIETSEEAQKRAERQAAAHEEAEAEKQLVTQPNGVAKLGAKFWASSSTTPAMDVFGQPLSSVGKEIFTVDDAEGHERGAAGVAEKMVRAVLLQEAEEEGEVPPPPLTDGAEEVAKELGQDERVVDSKNIFLDMD